MEETRSYGDKAFEEGQGYTPSPTLGPLSGVDYPSAGLVSCKHCPHTIGRSLPSVCLFYNFGISMVMLTSNRVIKKSDQLGWIVQDNFQEVPPKDEAR